MSNQPPDPFYRANPLALELLDNDGEAKLLISDTPSGNEGHISLRVKNVADQSIYLAAGSGPASATNHHFAVSFKPGVLSNYTLQHLIKSAGGDGNTNDWDLALQRESYWETIYLLRTKPVASGRWKFEPAKEILVSVDHLTADQAGGARGSRVQLRTNPNMVSFDNGGKQGLQETVGYNVAIISHHGKRTIPLHIGFIGATGNMVLNDSTANSLTLRVTNTGSAPLALKAAGAVSFTLKLDTGSNHTADQLTSGANAIQVSLNPGGNIDTPNMDKATGCVIPAAKLPDQLAPLGSAGDHFDIVLSEIKTTDAAGLSNLYVQYDVPGYWSGEVVCQILKTPLLYFTKAGTTFTGIGVRQPSATLQIDSRQNHLLLQNPHGGKGSEVHLNFSTYGSTDANPTVRITAQDDGHASSHLIFLTEKPNIKGPTGQLEERLRLTSDGKLGIGSDQPQSMLDVTQVADSKSSSLLLRSGNNADRFDSNQVALGWNDNAQYRHTIKSRHNANKGSDGNAIDFYVWGAQNDQPDTIGNLHTLTLDNGKVGIGTTNPRKTLEVNGDTLINGALTIQGSIHGPLRGPIVYGYIPRATSVTGKTDKEKTGSGDGYTWQYQGNGCYDVTFTTAFKHMPIVVANITWEGRSNVGAGFGNNDHGSDNTRDNVIILARSTTKVRFMTGDTHGGRYNDNGILFMAIDTIA